MDGLSGGAVAIDAVTTGPSLVSRLMHSEVALHREFVGSSSLLVGSLAGWPVSLNHTMLLVANFSAGVDYGLRPDGGFYDGSIAGHYVPTYATVRIGMTLANKISGEFATIYSIHVHTQYSILLYSKEEMS